MQWLLKLSRALRQRSGKRRQQRGGTVVEFALVLPLFMLVLFGAIDGGRLVVSQVMLSYAVISGARLAGVSSTTGVLSTVRTAVVAAAPLLNLSAGTVHYQINGGGADSGTPSVGDTVRVYTSYSYKPLVVPIFSQRTVNASAESVVQ